MGRGDDLILWQG
ncbi:hypothetical protein YPPY15_1515, partial [Yersinia pestis PY-15]